MSLSVVGFRPPDEAWQKMKRVWDSCKEAKVSPPKEVYNFFEGQDPDAAGVLVDIQDKQRRSHIVEGIGCVRKYSADGVDGLEVFLDHLPPGVKILRFTVSY